MERLFDTAEPEAPALTAEGGYEYPLKERSLVLFRQAPLGEAPGGAPA